MVNMILVHDRKDIDVPEFLEAVRHSAGRLAWHLLLFVGARFGIQSTFEQEQQQL